MTGATTKPQAPDLIASAEAARVLGLSPERLRQLTKGGDINAIRIHPNGYRAYERSDVEKFKAQRAKAGRKC